MKFKNYLISIILRLLLVNTFINKLTASENQNKVFPIILSTWDSKLCADAAWETLYNNKSAIDAIEKGCSVCEEILCRGTVGFGKRTDEKGEVTQDAMLMDGVTMDVGAVGSLRRVKSAISVARRVLENTEHSLLVGEQATDFAVEMGFEAETHMPNSTIEIWKKWKCRQCQPNHRKNVSPNPKRFCGPYKPSNEQESLWKNIGMGEENHDTIGMVAIDYKGHIAAGTSTNGLQYKIPGRVGDSPIPGSGAFADQEVGAAAGTGDGDIMMRFVPSFLAVELMRNGATPGQATEEAVRRIAKHYPKFMGAVMAVNKNGDFGAACNGIERGSFNYHVSNPTFKEPKMMWVPCIDSK